MKSGTINLLPHIQEVSPATAHKTFLFWVSLLTGVVVLTGFTAYLWVDLKTIKEQTALKSLEEQDLKKAIGKADQVQEYLGYILDRKSTYEELELRALDYTGALQALAVATPQNLSLTTVSLDPSKIILTGVAAERAQAVTFTENLQKSKQFSSVLLSQANNQINGVQFTVTMDFTKAVPQPKASP